MKNAKKQVHIRKKIELEDKDKDQSKFAEQIYC